MADLVSIIIPVFNGEKFIVRCIQSALSQTYNSIEVIVVNDGSTDRTRTMAEEMQAKDNRVKVINQINGGVSKARKTGLEKSSGLWVCFLDADDELPQQAIEEYSSLFPCNPDIIVSGWEKPLSQEDYLSGILKLNIHPELWGKVFNSDFLKLHMPDIDKSVVMGEDMLQNLVMGLHAKKIVTLPTLQYRINGSNPTSVTKVFKRSFEYERRYFTLLDDLFFKKCDDFPFFEHIRECILWSKLNGMKQVVLDGNYIEADDTSVNEIVSFYRKWDNRLGLSELLFLRLIHHQKTYRFLMKSYLKARH